MRKWLENANFTLDPIWLKGIYMQKGNRSILSSTKMGLIVLREPTSSHTNVA